MNRFIVVFYIVYVVYTILHRPYSEPYCMYTSPAAALLGYFVVVILRKTEPFQ